MSAPSPYDAVFMSHALALAREAASAGEIPVGAVVVVRGVIVGRGFDQREITSDPTAHAEVVALREATARCGTWRLTGAQLFVTLEPCVLCMGAVLAARVDQVIYGAASPKSGAVESLLSLADIPGYNHRVVVRRGVLADESSALLATFFEKLRSRRASGKPVAPS